MVIRMTEEQPTAGPAPGGAGPVALVTGANRGLGLEVVRQLARRGHRVVLASRDLERGRRAAEGVVGAVEVVALDVTDPTSIVGAISACDDRYGRLDALVNNAAVHYDSWQHGTSPDFDVVDEAIETNLMGAWRTAVAAIPLLRRSPQPRIVNVSSGAGALAGMGGGTPAYRTSKAALNALTRILAAELAADGILVNSVCPGWVATDMGGAGGRPVGDGAAGIVWAATLPDGGPSGGFFRDGVAIDW